MDDTQNKATQTPEDPALSAQTPAEIQRLLHELRAHQLELERQNEELRRTQAELEAGWARHFNLYDLAPVGYLTLDEQGLIREANLTAATLFGTTRNALVRQPLSLFILKEELDRYYLHRQQLCTTPAMGATGSPPAGSGSVGEPKECELRMAKQDGAIFWAHLTTTVAPAADGAPLWRVLLTDITARKQAEAALQASEEQHRLLLQYLPVGVVVHAPDTRVLLANEVATLLLGLSWEQMQGKVAVDPAWCFVREDGRPLPLAEYPVSRVVATGQPVRGILLGIDRPAWVPAGAEPAGRSGHPERPGGGNRVWVLANAFPQFDDAGKLRQVEVTFIDLTERKQLEEIQHFMARTTSSQADESFFQELARYLARSLGMFYVCIDRLEGDGLNATTLAIWCDSHFEDNTTYALKDTPCGDVVGKQVCCFPASVCQYFPRDQVLQELCAESYIGVTLFSHSGQPIGLIAVIGREPLANRPLAESILKLVAIRAAGELERLFAEEKLQLSASVFSHAREGILITEADGSIIEVNEAFTRITGYPRDEVVGQNPRLLSSGRHGKEFYARFWLELSEKGFWSGEVLNRRKNGEVYPELLTVSAVKNTEGKTQHYVALFSDISALKEHEHQLEHIAHFDTLTNLPNRVLLADRLQQGMVQAQRRHQRLAAVFLDLDDFKAVNDHHGHAVGDQLLKILASRMKQTLREGDTLARLGGDEFVAVLLDLNDIESSFPILKRLLAAAAEPVQVGSLVLQVSASLGITFHPQSQDIDADQLLRQADQAMYQAKLSGKNRYQIFDATLDSHLRVHYESLEGTRLALARHELVLHYQPKVNMRSGQVIGVEALIRWQHPQHGLLAPSAFLPVFDDHPLAVAVGEWVIDTALTQMEVWQAAGMDLPVSVNVGSRQLQQSDFVERLVAILAAHPQVNPARLELEVVESRALADLDRVSRVIESCAQIGVKFALDDFGTGYSSLTYLKRLHVALLKIDQSFVRDLLDDPEDLAILEGVIRLATAFHCQVIAEGVGTLAQGVMLLQLGCELAQGYAIARPMPAAEIPAWRAGWCPAPGWLGRSAVARDQLPLLYAGVEHRAWVATCVAFLTGARADPPLERAACRFGVWLASAQEAAGGTPPALADIAAAHQAAHALAEELLALHHQGRNPEALARLGALYALRDRLLAGLAELLAERA